MWCDVVWCGVMWCDFGDLRIITAKVRACHLPGVHLAARHSGVVSGAGWWLPERIRKDWIGRSQGSLVWRTTKILSDQEWLHPGSGFIKWTIFGFLSSSCLYFSNVLVWKLLLWQGRLTYKYAPCSCSSSLGQRWPSQGHTACCYFREKKVWSSQQRIFWRLRTRHQ